VGKLRTAEGWQGLNITSKPRVLGACAPTCRTFPYGDDGRLIRPYTTWDRQGGGERGRDHEQNMARGKTYAHGMSRQFARTNHALLLETRLRARMSEFVRYLCESSAEAQPIPNSRPRSINKTGFQQAGVDRHPSLIFSACEQNSPVGSQLQIDQSCP
jgi:hypothetical protein